jgi:hypothetical protein
MPWTNVSKPTASTWTNLNPMGKEQYDQVDVTYDSAIVYYDGLVPNQWTNVIKPSTLGWTNVAKPT